MRSITFLLLLLISLFLKAEKLPPILRKLANAPGNVIPFSHMSEAFFPISDLPSNYNNQAQQILKTSKGLFLCQPGTGRVYQIVIYSDSIQLKRLDDTYFTGYNFQSLSFSLDTTIYSFGGYGFWKFNGDLRVYMPKIREWEIRTTDRYIARSFINENTDNFYFLDTLNKCLYVHGSKNRMLPTQDQYTANNPEYGKLFKLKIEEGIWEEIGRIKNDAWSKYRAITPNGILTQYKNGFIVLDPIHNTQYEYKGKTNEKLIHTPTSTAFQDIRISYCIGNMLYVGDMGNWIDSIYLDPKDLVDTGNPIYESENTNYILWTSIILIIILVISLLLVKKIKKKSKQNNLEEEKAPTITLHSSLHPELLDQREKDLLNFILEQSKNGKLTSIQEINDLLGVNKRTLEVQKRIRTDTIGAINEKCKFLTKKPESILSRTRSDIDKRMFEYFVNQERFADAENILNPS